MVGGKQVGDQLVSAAPTAVQPLIRITSRIQPPKKGHLKTCPLTVCIFDFTILILQSTSCPVDY